VPRGDLEPVYLDSSMLPLSGRPIVAEIGAAIAEAGFVGLGPLTLSQGERVVVVEPRGTGVPLFTLHAAEEVRAGQLDMAAGELDAETVATAKVFIAQQIGSFDPTTYRDRYQEGL
jgi:DNA end-binding protein Ku